MMFSYSTVLSDFFLDEEIILTVKSQTRKPMIAPRMFKIKSSTSKEPRLVIS